jgi:hypothetical protein
MGGDSTEGNRFIELRALPLFLHLYLHGVVSRFFKAWISFFLCAKKKKKKKKRLFCPTQLFLCLPPFSQIRRHLIRAFSAQRGCYIHRCAARFQAEKGHSGQGGQAGVRVENLIVDVFFCLFFVFSWKLRCADLPNKCLPVSWTMARHRTHRAAEKRTSTILLVGGGGGQQCAVFFFFVCLCKESLTFSFFFSFPRRRGCRDAQRQAVAARVDADARV